MPASHVCVLMPTFFSTTSTVTDFDSRTVAELEISRLAQRGTGERETAADRAKPKQATAATNIIASCIVASWLACGEKKCRDDECRSGLRN